MKRRQKYLTVEEKRQLALEGKRIPVCTDERTDKKRITEQKKLSNTFFKNAL